MDVVTAVVISEIWMVKSCKKEKVIKKKNTKNNVTISW